MRHIGIGQVVRLHEGVAAEATGIGSAPLMHVAYRADPLGIAGGCGYRAYELVAVLRRQIVGVPVGVWRLLAPVILRAIEGDHCSAIAEVGLDIIGYVCGPCRNRWRLVRRDLRVDPLLEVVRGNWHECMRLKAEGLGRQACAGGRSYRSVHIVASIGLTAFSCEVAAAGGAVVTGAQLAVVAVRIGLAQDVARATAAAADQRSDRQAVRDREEPGGSARAGLVLAAPAPADDGRAR